MTGVYHPKPSLENSIVRKLAPNEELQQTKDIIVVFPFNKSKWPRATIREDCAIIFKCLLVFIAARINWQ